MIKLKGVDETMLVNLIRLILISGYRPVITLAKIRSDGLCGLYDVAIITNGEDR